MALVGHVPRLSGCYAAGRRAVQAVVPSPGPAAGAAPAAPATGKPQAAVSCMLSWRGKKQAPGETGRQDAAAPP